MLNYHPTYKITIVNILHECKDKTPKVIITNKLCQKPKTLKCSTTNSNVFECITHPQGNQTNKKQTPRHQWDFSNHTQKNKFLARRGNKLDLQQSIVLLQDTLYQCINQCLMGIYNAPNITQLSSSYPYLKPSKYHFR